MGFLAGYLRFINNMNDWVGKVVSFFVIPIMLILIWEVVARYVFDAPTFWAHETSEMFYGVHFMIAGSYCLRWKAHVNIDFLYGRLSVRRKAILDLFTWTVFFFFAGVLLWKTGLIGWTSFLRLEGTGSSWNPPLWPVKVAIPIAVALLLIQGISKYINDIYTAITGHELVVYDAEKEVAI